MVLDGELIALDSAGKPLRFQALQQGGSSGFAVFDILSLAKRDLKSEPWTARRAILTKLLPRSARALVRLSPSYVHGTAAARSQSNVPFPSP